MTDSRGDETRWWRLYRAERAKIAPGKAGWRRELKPWEIVRAAREATRRFKEAA